MWRISAIARATPKSSIGGSAIRAGTRRCFRDMRASSSVIASDGSSSKMSYQRGEPQRNNQLHHKIYSSRHTYHTTPLVGARWADDEDADPNDPDDIPDFLDEDDFASYKLVDEEEEAREQYRLQQEKVNDELDNRKGRPWKDPWEIKEEQWMATDTSSDSLPDWNPSFVSRISLERLQVLAAEGMA